MATIEDIIGFGDRLREVREAAVAHGIAVSDLIGRGGYGVVFGCAGSHIGDGALKLALIWPSSGHEHPDLVSLGHGPHHIYIVSKTGPFVARGVRTEAEARRLLAATCLRQSERPCAVLPKLLGCFELAGVQAAVYERLDGTSLRRNGPVWRQTFERFCHNLAEALLTLHRDFGPHGDLKPEHIICSRPEFKVRLIDPLCSDQWIGSVGYTLGRALDFGLPGGVSQEELDKCVDVGALVPIFAELFGGNVGWSGRVLYLVANRFNGRFGQGFDIKRLEGALDRAILDAPEPLRSWLARVGRDVIGLYSMTPWDLSTTTIAEGWAEARLRELAVIWGS